MFLDFMKYIIDLFPLIIVCRFILRFAFYTEYFYKFLLILFKQCLLIIYKKYCFFLFLCIYIVLKLQSKIFLIIYSYFEGYSFDVLL